MIAQLLHAADKSFQFRPELIPSGQQEKITLVIVVGSHLRLRTARVHTDKCSCCVSEGG